MKPEFRVWIVKDKKYYPVLGYVKDDGYGTQILISKAELKYEWIDLDDNILESSTGEHDRNGKEIFEGDEIAVHAVVNDGDGITEPYTTDDFCGHVEFKNGEFGFEDKNGNGWWNMGSIIGSKIEVIGHIHEEVKK